MPPALQARQYDILGAYHFIPMFYYYITKVISVCSELHFIRYNVVYLRHLKLINPNSCYHIAISDL